MNEDYKLPGQLTGTQSNRVGAGEFLNLPISSATLQQSSPIDLTQKPMDTSPYTSILGGGNSIIGANDAAMATAPVDVKKETMTQIQGLLPPPKPSVSSVDVSGAQSSLATKEENFNVAAKAEQDARDKYNALNAQLQQFNYNASTLIPAALQEQSQGRGITKAGLAPIQAGELRKNALAAAPIQFNALIAQAELASAQGRTALAQGVLEQASNHLDKMVELQRDDAKAQYDHQTNIFDKVWDYANESEKRTLEALAKKKEEEFTLQRDKINNDYAQQKMLLQQQIDANDPLKKAQIAKLESEIGEASVGVQTITGKPQTTVQATANGYADRLAEANVVLTTLGDKFAGNFAYGGWLPNMLQSADRQAYEQAKRNFVTAILRRESGAAISPTEFDTAEKQYFPQAGDKPETVVQKINARNTAINNIYREANVVRPVLPGDIIFADGVKYRVGTDGETLEQI